MSGFQQLLQDLVVANHIIHHNGVVDAFGHISVRHPEQPDVFLMSGEMAPALVRAPADFVEYRVVDSSPVHQDAPRGFIERYIHSEIYKRYPDVQCVVHSHAEEVLPFAVSGVPLKPVFHMTGFLGQEVPVWDIEEHYQPGDCHDLLVRSCEVGAALASEFSTQERQQGLPDHALVLMRRHGFTTCGSSIKEAVYRAIYATKNAKVQTTSTLLRETLEEGKGSSRAVHSFEPLTTQQAEDCAATAARAINRPWGLWVQEVKCQPLYTSPR